MIEAPAELASVSAATSSVPWETRGFVLRRWWSTVVLVLRPLMMLPSVVGDLTVWLLPTDSVNGPIRSALGIIAVCWSVLPMYFVGRGRMVLTSKQALIAAVITVVGPQAAVQLSLPRPVRPESHAATASASALRVTARV